jgi:hypothetical protein
VRISGFTFVRNAVRYRYPLEAAIRSVLPLVDEMIVNVGISDDGTRELVESIQDPRIVILDSEWDESLVKSGRVYAEQTDIALARCTGDACIYFQADELLHEDEHPRMREAIDRMMQDEAIEGLLIDFIHFYGSYHTEGTSRLWVRRDVRAFRNHIGVRSWKDALGFRIWDPPPGFAGPVPRTLKPGDPARKLRVVSSHVRMFHYGWVRPPELQTVKLAEQARFHHGQEAADRKLREGFTYDVTEKVRPFVGTHPAPIRDLVARADWPFEPRRRFVRAGHVRVDLLDLLEDLTGIRVGEYRNYDLIRR